MSKELEEHCQGLYMAGALRKSSEQIIGVIMDEDPPTLRKEKLHIQEAQQTPSVTDWSPCPGACPDCHSPHRKPWKPWEKD